MSDADFDALYARLPTIECKGLCARSCGPVASTLPEAERAGAVVVATDADSGLWASDRKNRCHKVRNGRCTIYELRPLLCRLWGVVESMPCLWGCVPSRMLTHEEGFEFLAEARQIAADRFE